MVEVGGDVEVDVEIERTNQRERERERKRTTTTTTYRSALIVDDKSGGDVEVDVERERTTTTTYRSALIVDDISIGVRANIYTRACLYMGAPRYNYDWRACKYNYRRARQYIDVRAYILTCAPI